MTIWLSAARNRLVLVLPFLFLSLASCTSTQDANQGLSSSYLGTNVDNFFIEKGPPISSQKLTDGRMLYVWSEKGHNIPLPSTSRTTVNAYGSSAYATTTTTPGGNIEVQCQVKILTSPQGIIERIEAHNDSLGMWELSRCAELFRIRQ